MFLLLFSAVALGKHQTILRVLVHRCRASYSWPPANTRPHRIFQPPSGQTSIRVLASVCQRHVWYFGDKFLQFIVVRPSTHFISTCDLFAGSEDSSRPCGLEEGCVGCRFVDGCGGLWRVIEETARWYGLLFPDAVDYAVRENIEKALAANRTRRRSASGSVSQRSKVSEEGRSRQGSLSQRWSTSQRGSISQQSSFSKAHSISAPDIPDPAGVTMALSPLVSSALPPCSMHLSKRIMGAIDVCSQPVSPPKLAQLLDAVEDATLLDALRALDGFKYRTRRKVSPFVALGSLGATFIFLFEFRGFSHFWHMFSHSSFYKARKFFVGSSKSEDSFWAKWRIYPKVTCRYRYVIR